MLRLGDVSRTSLWGVSQYEVCVLDACHCCFGWWSWDLYEEMYTHYRTCECRYWWEYTSHRTSPQTLGQTSPNPAGCSLSVDFWNWWLQIRNNIISELIKLHTMFVCQGLLCVWPVLNIVQRVSLTSRAIRCDSCSSLPNSSVNNFLITLATNLFVVNLEMRLKRFIRLSAL